MAYSLQECESPPMQISREDWPQPQCTSASSAASGIFVREVEEDEESIAAPPFSPISDVSYEETHTPCSSSNESDSDIAELLDEPLLELPPANLDGSTSAPSNQCSSQVAWHG